MGPPVNIKTRHYVIAYIELRGDYRRVCDYDYSVPSGWENSRRHTTDPQLVTCLKCMRTLLWKEAWDQKAVIALSERKVVEEYEDDGEWDVF